MCRTGIVIGATGLVGSHLVDLLLQDSEFSKVIIFVRRATGRRHEKLEEHCVDFEHIDTWSHLVTGDILFSSMGTTIKRAGSREKQYRVDYTYQYMTAEVAARNGVSHLSLVSSSGASENSLFFYMKMKGNLDRDVQALPFQKIDLFRPSLLTGKRDVPRTGERAAEVIMKGVIKLLPFLRKYRPVSGKTLAASIIHHSLHPELSRTRFFTLDEVFYVKKDSSLLR